MFGMTRGEEDQLVALGVMRAQKVGDIVWVPKI